MHFESPPPPLVLDCSNIKYPLRYFVCLESALLWPSKSLYVSGLFKALVVALVWFVQRCKSRSLLWFAYNLDFFEEHRAYNSRLPRINMCKSYLLPLLMMCQNDPIWTIKLHQSRGLYFKFPNKYKFRSWARKINYTQKKKNRIYQCSKPKTRTSKTCKWRNLHFSSLIDPQRQFNEHSSREVIHFKCKLYIGWCLKK